MAVTDIYVLPSNYPKFDWADWPESAAALVSDAYTHEFGKEAWNAIVDLLRGALANVDVEWDDTYTTAAGARITEEYGDFRAAAINSVRHNIDMAIPVLRWGWANDPTFRGYIGRKDFRGIDAYGATGADDVYPEYIVELAARLNFMLSVMTGEAAKVLQTENIANSLHSAEMGMQWLYILAAEGQGQSEHDASILLRASRALCTEQILQSDYDTTLRRCVAAQMGHEYTFLSDYEGQMAKPVASRLGGHRHSFVSEYMAEMEAFKAWPIVAKLRSWSQNVCDIATPTAFSLGAFCDTATTIHDAESVATPSSRLNGEGRSATRHCAGGARTESRLLIVQGQSASIQGAGLALALNIGFTASESCTAAAVSLNSAWWPPVWQSGNYLWIRQSHVECVCHGYEATLTDGVLEVV